jgi:hypothetical protein
MYCTNCGKKISESDNFCPNCRHKNQKVAEKPAAATTNNKVDNKSGRNSALAILIIFIIIGIIYLIMGSIFGVAIYKYILKNSNNTNNNSSDTSSYSADYRTNYINGCIKSAGGETYRSYCECTYNYIETHFTYDQTQKMETDYTNTKVVPQGLKDAANSCLSSLPKSSNSSSSTTTTNYDGTYSGGNSSIAYGLSSATVTVTNNKISGTGTYLGDYSSTINVSITGSVDVSGNVSGNLSGSGVVQGYTVSGAGTYSGKITGNSMVVNYSASGSGQTYSGTITLTKK